MVVYKDVSALIDNCISEISGKKSMVYIAGWMVMFSAGAIVLMQHKMARASLFIALTFVMVIAMARGQVGTDTFQYSRNVSGDLEHIVASGNDMFFVGLTGFLALFVTEPDVIVRFLSFPLFVVLFIVVFRASKNEQLVVAWFVLPIFSYQFAMNNIRAGFALSLLLLSVQQCRIHNVKSGVIIALLSPFAHVSALIGLAYIGVCLKKCRLGGRIKNVSTMLLGGVLGVFIFIGVVMWLYVAYAIGAEHPESVPANAGRVPIAASPIWAPIFERITRYFNIDGGSVASGLRYVVVCGVLLVGWFFTRSSVKASWGIIVITAGCLLSFFIVAKYSYAGLRILEVIAFCFSLVLLFEYGRAQKEFGKFVKAAICVSGTLGALAVWRGFVNEKGHGPSPFLPYQVFHGFPF